MPLEEPERAQREIARGLEDSGDEEVKILLGQMLSSVFARGQVGSPVNVLRC